jgi:hypothetical protein
MYPINRFTNFDEIRLEGFACTLISNEAWFFRIFHEPFHAEQKFDMGDFHYKMLGRLEFQPY